MTASAGDDAHEPTAPEVVGLLDHPDCLAVPEEEVRFAVILNGGVALAVWMGGVVLELDRLTKAGREGSDPYAVLRRLTGCRARADVISGTSAGGINGAALALTQVNRGADPALLRDLWIDQGRLESLLRPPFRGQPTSLLKGDEYFLPRLNAALQVLAEPVHTADPVPPEEAPIDLTITTTVIQGNQAISVDSMGQQLPQSIHAGRFQWRRPLDTAPPPQEDGPDPAPSAEPEPDDPFSRSNLSRTADRLALASRASASFPLAFEPAFVPVGSPDHRGPLPGEELTEELRLRPDMAGQVRSWGTGDRGSDRSRFCADGGALANTPTRAALEAVEAMPAAGPVRRVMLLVFPHAPQVGVDPPESADEPPTLVGALTGLLGALTAQGSRSHVETLERHNLAAAGRRGTRGDLLWQLVQDGTDAATPPLSGPLRLAELTGQVYPTYRRLRRWRAGRDLAAWRTGMAATDDFAVSDLTPEWSFERVRAAAQQAQDAWAAGAAGRREALPYTPHRPPRAADLTTEGWGYGVSGALGVAESVADLLRRLVWVLGPHDGPTYAGIRTARAELTHLTGRLRAARRLTDGCWQSREELTALAPDAAYWTLRLACYDRLMVGRVAVEEIRDEVRRVGGADWERVWDALDTELGLTTRRPGWVGLRVRGQVDEVVRQARRALAVLSDHQEALVGRDEQLGWWRRVLAPEPDLDTVSDTELLARLLELEILSTTLGDEVSTGASFPVELVQISAETANPFAVYSRTMETKLGGEALNRFGGFLKRSWRVNDWIWGRVDGATGLARTMLDPRRIRRTAVLAGYLDPSGGRDDAARRAAATVDEVIAALGGFAEIRRLRDAAAAELTDVFDLGRTEADLPSALPDLAAIFAWALHRRSVPAELPTLAQAIAADRVDGANPRSRGEIFVEEQRDLLSRLDAGGSGTDSVGDEDRRRALQVFDRALIGGESLQQEASSDLVIRTATSAAAVLTTVVDSDRSGLAAAKPVTRVLRGAMLLPYWTIWSLTSRQALARGLALLGLALGGVMLALALFGVLGGDLQPIAAALGAGALLAGFAYGALRTGSLLHSVVLLTPVIPLTAYALESRNADARGVSTVAIVILLALGLMLLGSIGVASTSVWGALDRLADRRGIPAPGPPSRTWWSRAWRVVKVLLRWVQALVTSLVGPLLLALALALVAVAVGWLVEPARIEFVQRNHKWLWAPAVVTIVAGATAAWVGGRWLQVLTRRESRAASASAGAPTGTPGWAYAPVVEPRATAAGWSVLYGTAYLVVAWAISLELFDPANPWWRRTAFATTLVFAVVLLVVVPVVLPWLAVREAVSLEAARAAQLRDRLEADQANRRRSFMDSLVVRGVSYRRFVGHRAGEPVLTSRGEAMEQRAIDAFAAGLLLRQWPAHRRLIAADVDRLRHLTRQWAEEDPRLRELISAYPRACFDALRSLLGQPDPPPDEVRHRTDRLVAALRRTRVPVKRRRSRR